MDALLFAPRATWVILQEAGLPGYAMLVLAATAAIAVVCKGEKLVDKGYSR